MSTYSEVDFAMAMSAFSRHLNNTWQLVSYQPETTRNLQISEICNALRELQRAIYALRQAGTPDALPVIKDQRAVPRFLAR